MKKHKRFNIGTITSVTFGALISLFLMFIPLWLYLCDIQGAYTLIVGGFFDYIILIGLTIWCVAEIHKKRGKNESKR